MFAGLFRPVKVKAEVNQSLFAYVGSSHPWSSLILHNPLLRTDLRRYERIFNANGISLLDPAARQSKATLPMKWLANAKRVAGIWGHAFIQVKEGPTQMRQRLCDLRS